ncbi:heterokaryon incompatibility protein-domain-containing protein [Rhexocercosporidium sp. MPI-PUGE-AT-0058]|nr:heterokaryon incompatibility protein-domain-containing protein [Rhexocercosporidium sp. MPI-PUGE-AT-0058]
MADLHDHDLPSEMMGVGVNGTVTFESHEKRLSEFDGRNDRSHIKISLFGSEAINIPTAFARHPSHVRQELIEAIRHVELDESDINLLMLETIMKSALKKPSSVTAEQLMRNMETFQHDDSESLGSLFYKCGRNYGMIVFVLATAADSGLLARLEQLSKPDQILLIQRLTEEPPRDFSQFLSDFDIADAQCGDDPPKDQHCSSRNVLSPQMDIDSSSSCKSPPKLATTLDRYNHFQLPEWADFRLVMLERESQTPEVRCHLIPASSQDHTNYEALSYTWGEGLGDARPISVSGKSFSVTKNLHSALQRLRKGGSGKYRCLWIDSMCIDQSNGKERSHQVAMMGQIYQNSQRVLVWIGEHSGNSEKAIDFITEVFQSSRSYKSKKFSSYMYEGDERYEASEWHAVDSLFRRDYWERTWIIQEIQLAKSVLVHCGGRVFDWTAGSAFYDFLQVDRDRHLETDPGSVAIKQRVMQTPAIQLLETALIFQKRGMNLKQLLYRHENSLCRESRDKIYGMLALASDCKERKFEPDYEKDLSAVYRDALGLEMTTFFSGQAASPDMVHYSHFLQKILKLSLSNPASLPVSMARDPICILGYSCGKLREGNAKHESTYGIWSSMYKMLDSELLVYKGPDPPQNNAFGYILDPTTSTIGYTWLEPPDAPKKFSLTIEQQEAVQSTTDAVPASEVPIIKTFVLPGGQDVLVPDVAQEGDEICMFSKHDMAVVLREAESGDWRVICNAFVLTQEDKRRRRPRKELRSFQYCVPDYDIFPPPTSDPRNSFHIRMSTRTLQWMTRIYKY